MAPWTPVAALLVALIQLPASLLTAFLGAPCFLWLMYGGRTRAVAAD